jgi:hypothetical protein
VPRPNVQRFGLGNHQRRVYSETVANSSIRDRLRATQLNIALPPPNPLHSNSVIANRSLEFSVYDGECKNRARTRLQYVYCAVFEPYDAEESVYHDHSSLAETPGDRKRKRP